VRQLSHSLCVLLLAACGSETPATPAAPAAPTLPAGLFPTSPPPAAKDVEDVKKTAKAGDAVVLQAQVGGRKQWQVPGQTIFLVIDPVLESCNEMEGDDCATPWDFCCVPKEEITKKLATVRVLGADGQPVAGSVEGVHGLKPLAHVVVAGKVASNDGVNLVLDAQQIWVKG
jgi:hypothetical protein